MKKLKLVIPVVAVLLAGIFYLKCGLYTIQPIGAYPDGGTWLVWRESDEPFFNSADGFCLRRVGSVSLLSRGIALDQAPTDRIILKFPYWHFAYLRSTGGEEFDK